MEGSGMGGGPAAVGDAGGDGVGQGNGEQQGTPDIASLSERLGEMAQGQEEMRSFLMSLNVPQGEGDYGLEDLVAQVTADDPNANGLGDGFDLGELAQGDDPEALAASLMDAVGQHVEQHVAERMAPIQQQMHEQQIDHEVRDLVARYPGLQDSETMQSTMEAARVAVEAAGLPLSVAVKPQFLGLVYMAGRAHEMAQDEDEDMPPAAHLEGGGGAGPGAARQAGMSGMDIVNAGRAGARALPFS